jgi:hypothetical protein
MGGPLFIEGGFGFVGGWGGRENSAFGEIVFLAVADGSFALGEGAGAAIVGLLASVWGQSYSGLASLNLLLLLKRWVRREGEVFARWFRI